MQPFILRQGQDKRLHFGAVHPAHYPQAGLAGNFVRVKVRSSTLEKAFNRLAENVALAAGRAWAFVLCVVSVVLWAIAGPAFHYSETWQLIINTATTMVTFLMVFLIQNTQNR
ncbi:MAG: low affinity iron permease family protein, partial [Mesorhizobium sp.]